MYCPNFQRILAEKEAKSAVNDTHDCAAAELCSTINNTLSPLAVFFTQKYSGAIEFDEFLDIVWDIKHARGLLLSRAGVFLEETLSAAQAALLSKMRQNMKLSLPGEHRGDLRSRTSTTSATTILSMEDESNEEEKVMIVQGRQQQPTRSAVAATATKVITAKALSSTVAWGKEAALSLFPKIARKKL